MFLGVALTLVGQWAIDRTPFADWLVAPLLLTDTKGASGASCLSRPPPSTSRLAATAEDRRLFWLNQPVHEVGSGQNRVEFAEDSPPVTAAKRYLLHAPVKPLIDIPRMRDAFVRRDVALAESALAADDALDALKSQIFHELLTDMMRDTAKSEPALDLILVSRHLGQVGDHATNIAEDAIFLISATDIRHLGAASGL